MEHVQIWRQRSTYPITATVLLMPDLAHCERLERAFAVLLRGLEPIWPKQDIDYIADEIGYAEYGDALENLIAMGLNHGRSFTSDQKQQIEALASMMKMEVSEWLEKLRNSATRNP